MTCLGVHERIPIFQNVDLVEDPSHVNGARKNKLYIKEILCGKTHPLLVYYRIFYSLGMNLQFKLEVTERKKVRTNFVT